MEHPSNRARFAGRIGPCWMAALALTVFLLPCMSGAADLSISSKTYLHLYQREFAGGQSNDYAPLYEYLSADAYGLGGSPVSFHFYGWGRQDLGDPTGGDKTSGELSSAYLQYLHPTGNGEARLGRFFLTEGTAMETMDGIFLKARSEIGFGGSVFGGIPVEKTITSTDTGDSIFGGRLFYAKAGIAEIGVSYLQENGDFQGDDRKEIGGDLWLRPIDRVELIGRATYNDSTGGMAFQRYVVRVTPTAGLDVSGGFEEYEYRDSFQTALNPVFLFPTINNDDRVTILFLTADWEVAKKVVLVFGVKDIRHELDFPGDAYRVEAAAKYFYTEHKDVAGFSAAHVEADRDENTYQEYRAFATYSPARWKFSLDALTQRYERSIAGVKRTYQVVGSAGYRVLDILHLSGDLIYTESPRFEEDFAGLIRVSLNFGIGPGGGK